MAKITAVPENFSSVQNPVLFGVSQDFDYLVAEVGINGYVKQVAARSFDVNVADYFRGNLAVAPLPTPDGELGEYEGSEMGRMVKANITVNGETTSGDCYLVPSLVKLQQNRFLTDLKRRHYLPGQVDELSVVSGSNDALLGVSLHDALNERPTFPTAGGEAPAVPVQFRSFSIRPAHRYALLVDSAGRILDRVEFVKMDGFTGVRLAWVNRYGVLDYWNFDTVQAKESKSSKTKIYAPAGYNATSISAEDTTTVSTRYLDEQTLYALSFILTAEKVWQVAVDGNYREVDVLSDSATTYTLAGLSALQVQFRPKTRRL